MKFAPKTIHLCIAETGNSLSWLDSFDFKQNNKNVSGSIQVDLLDPINEYIPVLRTMISTVKEEYFFVHLREENGKPKCMGGGWAFFLFFCIYLLYSPLVKLQRPLQGTPCPRRCFYSCHPTQ